MFIRASAIAFSVAALAGVATAAPTALETRDSGNTCNSGTIQCCSSVEDSSSAIVDNLFGSLRIPLPPAGTQVGLTCSPLTAGGTGSGATCTQQTVCCNGDSFSGLIVIGCSPIIINIIL